MYVCSWSGGKDSTATIILAHNYNEPLDLILFSEVMFDDNTSGELPEHIEFIHKCIPIFKAWGYPVKIVHADRTFKDMFFTRLRRSHVPERIGKCIGFPLGGRCYVNSRLKIHPIRTYIKTLTPPVIQYVGIAKDEPERLKRLDSAHISLLAKYNATEKAAYKICKHFDMLSPVYSNSSRGGCFFCPNAHQQEIDNLKVKHPNLYNDLCSLERAPDLINNCWDRRGWRYISDM